MARSPKPKKQNPIFEFSRRCMCGRPAKRARCALCIELRIRNPLLGHQYLWVEDKGCANPQIKHIGFGKLNSVCGQCVHFARHTFTVPAIEREGTVNKGGFICKNVIDVKPWNAFWPACHNFQERPSVTPPRKKPQQKAKA